MSFINKIKRLFRSAAAQVIHLPIRGRFDIAQTSDGNRRHWAAADGLDADSAHNVSVRRMAVQRSRMELANNGFGTGILRTHRNYVVGRGPKLRLQTGSPGFNAMIEARWKDWSKKVKLAIKLRTAQQARTRDGESFCILRDNPNSLDPVKLDLKLVECEQVTTPGLAMFEANHIDGIKFDAFDNPEYFEVLPAHPGAAQYLALQQPIKVPAKFMLHLFGQERPSQHRAMPELSSTLGNFAGGRRWRESTLQAAENVANFSLIVKTEAPPETGPAQLVPFETVEIDKGMMTALPAGGDVFQPKVEQPAASYTDFNRAQVSEQARPLNMPYNIAACDSSGYSFSGGKLDHLTYFEGVDIEQSELEDLFLDPLFEVWFAEAARVYSWYQSSPQGNVYLSVPAHTWDWPARPIIDEQKTASARQTDLGTGVKSLRRVLAEDGYDFEEELIQMAEDYGVTVEQMRARLFETNFRRASAAPAEQGPGDGSQETGAGSQEKTPARNGNNGKSRF